MLLVLLVIQATEHCCVRFMGVTTCFLVRSGDDIRLREAVMDIGAAVMAREAGMRTLAPCSSTVGWSAW